MGSGYPEPSLIGTMPSYGLFARHVRGLELADISFDYDKEDFRPAIRCINVVGDKLYDIKADPKESTDIAEKHPEIAQRLTTALTASRLADIDPVRRPRFG